MDKMVYLKQKFNKKEFPYRYVCENCGERFEKTFEMSKEEDRRLKRENGVISKDPIFFECHFCHDDAIKPIGYKGKPSFIIEAF